MSIVFFKMRLKCESRATDYGILKIISYNEIENINLKYKNGINPKFKGLKKSRSPSCSRDDNKTKESKKIPIYLGHTCVCVHVCVCIHMYEWVCMSLSVVVVPQMWSTFAF